ncbi:uncharacterized protein LOC118802171 [Colossoma macropomum]|uniref:uncharacterized protein LOC118802171 n=1 Tax=Colossoma macropomum TaxID=42526 RepID=UPI001864321C|nr:uncharacterized protein LOC118802171 [Colossoma macropomum]
MYLKPEWVIGRVGRIPGGLVAFWDGYYCLTETLGVSCGPRTQFCALQESKVEFTCSYSKINIKTVFWFSFKQKAKWRNETHPEDLALDSDYTGRVNTQITSFSSTLTIRDLRERDSGEYHLMIITEQGEKHLSSTAVNLTVTGLQVTQKRPNTLNCGTSCTLTSVYPLYFWFKNGQNTRKSTNFSGPLILSSDDEGSFSCSVFGYNSIPSPSLCVSGENCWSVTYTDRRVCVLKGSSVDFHCTYSYPSNQSITEAFWHYCSPEEGLKDLRQEEQFAGRVEFIGDQLRNCTLRMRDVRKNDSGEYRFRFITKTKEGKFSGKPGITLNVTALQVRVISSTASDGQTVTLMCSSTCTLPNNPTYIWYKNGQLVSNKLTRDNKLYLKCSEDAGNYSCAVRGHEELRSPDQTLGDCLLVPEESSVLVTVGVVVFLALILITAALWRFYMSRRRRGAERDSDIQTPDPADHTYTALNPTTMTSDYDTLIHLTDSPSDTYTALNPETMCSDYDTLTRVAEDPGGYQHHGEHRQRSPAHKESFTRHHCTHSE